MIKLLSFARFFRYHARQIIHAARLFNLMYDRAPQGNREDFAKYAHLIESLRAQTDRQNSPFYSFHVYQEVSQMARRYGHEPRRVLELGTGSSLGVLFCFRAGGAERAVGVDIQPIQKNLAFYQMLKDYLACVGGYKWWRFFATKDNCSHVHYPNFWESEDTQTLLDSIEYFAPVSSHDLPFGECEFDLVYSCSAMEHFEHPKETVQQMQRVLAPGGLAYHGIDLRSHFSGDDLLGHLRLEEKEYLRLTRKYGNGHGIDQVIQGEWKEAAYCNRLLAKDWIRTFEEAGLVIRRFDVNCEQDSSTINPLDYAKPFNTCAREELSPLVIWILAQRLA